ncbi:MAG: carboxypeptidase regulatory-like domain-containing protein [Acidobacteria bacterium]|nr:carboxypeptidase regulatory-like domain-containing protein [Acidobacteriota bacterium]
MSDVTAGRRGLARVVALMLAVMATAAGVGGRQAEVVLTGRVVDAVSGAPVADAAVTVSAGVSQTVDVGSNGHFSVSLPGPGVRTRIYAHAPGYLRGFPAQRGAADTLANSWGIEPTAGRPVEDIVLRLWRAASIAGVVVDDDQQPVAGARLMVMTRVFTGSGLRWLETSIPSPFTDDLGQFDVPDLVPGSYLVAARPPADPRAGGDVLPPVTFYPGTPVAAEAQVVSLEEGTDVHLRISIDFSRALGTVRGRLAGVDDLSGHVVHLIPEMLAGEVSPPVPLSVISGGMPLGGRTVRPRSDGAFEFRAVPPGHYRLRTGWPPEMGPRLAMGGDFQRLMTYSFDETGGRVSPSSRPGANWMADVPVAIVGTDPVDVSVSLSPGASIRGRVESAGPTPLTAAQMAALSIIFRPADGVAFGAIPAAPVEGDGTFRALGLPPGDYVIALGQGSGWHVTSVMARGLEVVAGKVVLGTADLDGVVIRLSDRPASLACIVRDSRGRPVSWARVVIFPSLASERDQFHALPAQRRVVQVMADASGRFSVPLPPGGYLVAPVMGDLPVFWMAPHHLATLASGASDVLVESGRETTLNVTAP